MAALENKADCSDFFLPVNPDCTTTSTSTTSTTSTTTTTSTTSTTSTTTTTTTTINPTIYGLLYNWYAANNPLIAPAGWHVPIDSEFQTLFASLGSTTVPMKSVGNRVDLTGLWDKALNPLMEGTNTSKFNVTPSGVISNLGLETGRYAYGNYWCYDDRSPVRPDLGKYRNFGYGGNTMYSSVSFYNKHYGFDIRLVKDNVVGYPNIGDEGTMTDIDGNIYPTKRMPNGVVWTLENLRVRKYTNGVTIDVDPLDWSTRETGAIHNYNEI